MKDEIELLISQKSMEYKMDVEVVSGEEKVGDIFLENLDWINRSCELKLEINMNFFDEVTRKIIKYGFEYLNLNRIYVRIPEYEKDQIGILKNNGFLKEGVERQGKFFKGKFWDVIRFSILAEDYWRLSLDE
ncbi:hypothetical protein XJ44_06115 [Thermosipho affectus]|uniref:N-acetyltransferase domain-containing protein n=1 Tax=Thermosipho affectus TaxID=660294 RepID=A0ABX3IHV9_9BACT|nr:MULTISPECIES: GNAT family protein [Thermosipho]ANQ54647.1 hypothetical protein Y592_06230 [Thermosipho sp. 1070]APT73056.1 hypothetical protein BG95_06155 [Thermosipho sp. 1063]ONN27010.1 hypothetical protein XJ44_06115 [Thermosipho affectus]OOC42784.1 hypothetical protein XO08_06015 [Thermosipho sp. 1074]